MECSVSGDVSRYLNELYEAYDHFDVRQTTIGVDRERFETVAERPDGIAVRVEVEGKEGLIARPDGDDWVLPGGVFDAAPDPRTVADAAERWTGVQCAIDGLDQVSIVGVRCEGCAELWTVSATFTATATGGSPRESVVWRDRDASVAATPP
ncbi:NUDIX family hydrolase [Natronomonas moolapensis 8.8.11]|uniref:NUDIX family hydrolase n=1 Tax=Natronomonas moolapensis (strain DSM 18674 / CECT 7526 / JCM 14361 / 8.8.11) TaxID=268739 RepID=M1XS70_NATM8|nr:hypothetical protein [Natronomonas moolapensis]CCQ37165.1 NUDIX family hydrolase [Natronomonas moolapensis 8.8.11]